MARKPGTHCAYGHEFTPANTYITPGGTRRECRTCRSARNTGNPPGRPAITERARRQQIAWVDIDTLSHMIPYHDQAWKRIAACRPRPGEPPITSMFYTGKNAEGARLRDEARRMCEGCPVRLSCLAAGINDTDGTWGGTTYEQRKFIRKTIYEHRQTTREEVA